MMDVKWMKWPEKPGVNDLVPLYVMAGRVVWLLIVGLVMLIVLVLFKMPMAAAKGGGWIFRRLRSRWVCLRDGHSWSVEFSAERTEGVCKRCGCVRTIWYPAWPRRGKGGRDV